MPMKKPTALICTNCGSGFTRKWASRPGQSNFFCSRTCKSKFENGRKRVDETAYDLRYRYVTGAGKPMGEPRWVMQQFLGRALLAEEHFHPIDGDGLNNSIENLLIVKSGDHMREHHMLNLPVERIKSMYADGLSPRQIAKKLKVRINAIKRRLSDAGVVPRSRSEGVRLAKAS